MTLFASFLCMSIGYRVTRDARSQGRERKHDLYQREVQIGHEARDQALAAPARHFPPERQQSSHCGAAQACGGSQAYRDSKSALNPSGAATITYQASLGPTSLHLSALQAAHPATFIPLTRYRSSQLLQSASVTPSFAIDRLELVDHMRGSRLWH